MNVHIPEPDILIPDLIVVPNRPLAWQRQCLDFLFDGQPRSPQEKLVWSEAEIATRVKVIDTIKEQLRHQAAERKRLQAVIDRARYEVSCVVNYLEERFCASCRRPR